MKILVADKDPKTVEAIGLCCAIRWPHRRLLGTDDPARLLVMVERESPDVVVLDGDLGGGSGYDLCRELRSFSSVPIIMVIPSYEETDVMKALDAGADDCVGRPLRSMEMLARIIALLRRSQGVPVPSTTRPFISGALYVDLDSYEVRLNGSEVKLTFTEFEILRCLVRSPRRVVSPARLASQVWGEDADGYRNTLKVHIQNLRRKLGDNGTAPRYIINERGFGYKVAGN